MDHITSVEVGWLRRAQLCSRIERKHGAKRRSQTRRRGLQWRRLPESNSIASRREGGGAGGGERAPSEQLRSAGGTADLPEDAQGEVEDVGDDVLHPAGRRSGLQLVDRRVRHCEFLEFARSGASRRSSIHIQVGQRYMHARPETTPCRRKYGGLSPSPRSKTSLNVQNDSRLQQQRWRALQCSSNRLLNNATRLWPLRNHGPVPVSLHLKCCISRRHFL